MAKKKEKEEKKSWLDYKFIIIILVIVIVFLTIRLNDEDNKINYWVDNVHFETHTFYDEDKPITKSVLYFNLLSDKVSSIKERGLFTESTTTNKLDLNSALYFKCHNKVYDEFYYLSVFDYRVGLNVTLDKNGPLEGRPLGDFNNHYEIQDSIVNEYAKDIDNCVYLGMIK